MVSRKLPVIVALAILVLAGACTKQSKPPVTKMHVEAITQDAKASVFEQLDLGKSGFGPGDQLVEVAPVTTSGGTTLGTTYTTVTVLAGAKLETSTGMIDCSVDLSGGTVLFNGAFQFEDLGSGVVIPVVGGKGAYAGAGGTVKMVAPNDKQTNLSFDLLIPRTTN